jgi:hypothetical protein
MQQQSENRDRARVDLAVRALWSDHPLCQLYALAHGGWAEGVYRPAASWSLRQLIAFAESLPEQTFARLSGAGQ